MKNGKTNRSTVYQQNYPKKQGLYLTHDHVCAKYPQFYKAQKFFIPMWKTSLIIASLNEQIFTRAMDSHFILNLTTSYPQA